MTASTKPREPRPILIAGPTGSGKSKLALALAEALAPATVVNVDSMQVYAEIPILSAQPSAEEQLRAPHRLYGHVPAREAYSAGRFLRDAAAALADARAEGRRPIFVGGTGLYFKALLEGLSPIPAIPLGIRDAWREKAAALGAAEVHRELSRRDPGMAERLQPADTQRVTRALEVLDATGRSLSVWQQQKSPPVIGEDEAIRLVLRPQRAEVQARCDARLDIMFAQGAVAEAGRLAALQLAPALPAMRALGVRPLLRHLASEIRAEQALDLAKLETRQYVKRQETWLTRNMISWKHIETQQSESHMSKIVTFIDHHR